MKLGDSTLIELLVHTYDSNKNEIWTTRIRVDDGFLKGRELVLSPEGKLYILNDQKEAIWSKTVISENI